MSSNHNEDFMRLAVSKLRHRLERIEKGGGSKAIEKHEAKGKLTARDRLDYLFDSDRPRFEVGALTAYEMYQEYGGAPAAGVVVELGYVQGRLVVVVANDATVKAGAWFPLTAKKNLRAQEIAMENEVPIIYLVDSAGVFLPLQDEVFPDKEHFGRIFRNNAKMSSMGILQIAAVMGSCVAGGAYLPIMSDESIIVEGTGSIFLAGPYLVQAAIGEKVDKELLGGATTQSEISGIIDHKVADDKACLDKIKSLIAGVPSTVKTAFARSTPAEPISAKRLYELLPEDRSKPYPMDELLECLVDESTIDWYKEGYGQTILCGYAKVNGWSVGIVANNRQVVKSKSGEMQFGGVIYSDSADKAARFVMLCNQKNIPLVFVHDVTGFMVGKRSEHGGIIKDGAKLVNAVANTTVPKVSIVIGNSYGAGNYAMCGKAYDPNLIVAWPSARLAVMGGSQAAQVLAQIQMRSRAKKGEEMGEDTRNALTDEIKSRYDEQTTPYYAAARLWVDAIIDPKDTRKVISLAIEAASHAPLQPFNVGVLQV